MKVWVVSYSNYDDYEQHGIFSTLEKAQAYIDMVAAAQAEAGIDKNNRTYLGLDEVDLDELADRFPVFTVEIFRTDARRRNHGILHLNHVPKTQVRGDWSVTIYDRSYKNAIARIPETRRLYFPKKA